MAKTHAPELKMLAGSGISGPLSVLVPQFEWATGHSVSVRYGATPDLTRRAVAEPFDLGVAPHEVYADPAARARFAPGPTTDIARVGFGVAVRSGAAKPDISTAAALKQALLKAESIALLPASAAGAQVLRAFEQLSIADQMKAKTKPQTTPAAVPQAVASGDAELAVFLVNVLMAPGVDMVGPLPAELQRELVFTAAVATETKNAGTARALIAYLTTPDAAAVIRAKGMTPVR